MAQSDARFGYRAKLSRTDHDLSQPFGFTSAPGMLLPIWFDLATPGDSYYMSHDMPLLRSIQFIAPAMINVKVHYETFFVPMQMIYEPFENTVFSLKNLRSSLYDMTQLMNNNFPLLAYQDTLTDPTVSIPGAERFRAFRLADMLGLDALNFINRTSDSLRVQRTNWSPNFFPWQLCAYHTIYQYYYRLDDKENFSPIGCNIDAMYNQPSFKLSTSDFAKWFNIHQRAWDFDYFTSSYHSPIVSNENLQSVMPFGTYSSLIPRITKPLSINGGTSPNNSSTSVFAPSLPSSYSLTAEGSVSTASIRQLFANEKLAMITGRTKKNYDSQVLAHFGVEVPHDVKHDITLLHHDVFDLNVQEVTSLAGTEMSPLGELAGKSYAAGNGKQFKFTAPCHGVIMTIFSIEPKKRYITEFDRINSVVDAFDIPTPEFDRLGNVPMFRYEVGMEDSRPVSALNDIISWKERYYQYKRKMPKITWFGYAANGVNQFASYFLTSLPFASSSFSNNSSFGDGRTFPHPETADYYYIEPSCMDSLCVAHYVAGWQSEEGGENWNNTPWLAYSRDPFIVNSHVKCKKVSWMSKDGEPIYD